MIRTFRQHHKRLPFSHSSTAPTRDASSGLNAFSFADAATTAMYWGVMVPEWANVRHPWRIRLLYFANADISNLVYRLTWGVTMARDGSTTSSGGVIASGTTDYTVPASTTTRVVRLHTFETLIPARTLRTGDQVTLNIQRDGAHANDTLSAAWLVPGAWMTWGV